MQLAIDSLDRLVELLEEKGGRARASEAAALLFAVRQAPEGLARQLLARARRRRRAPLLARTVRRARDGARPAARNGRVRRLRPRDDRPCERHRADLRDRRRPRSETSSSRGEYQTLVAPKTPLPRPIGAPHRLDRRGAPRAPRASRLALRRFSKFAGGAVLVAHNARFDVGFVNRELERMTGKRLHATVIDTVPLARNLLGRRVRRTSLASLAYFFGVPSSPATARFPTRRRPPRSSCG